MRFALCVPNFRSYGDPRALVDLGRVTEAAGWDGFFIWDHLWRSLGLEPGQATVDPWVTLAAVATVTERIRLGPMITPVARRRPWKLAREIVTLDHLSGGRVIFGAGLGDPPAFEFEALGEDPDAKVRAQKLDEGLAIVRGLLSGERFSFDGEHYHVRDVHFGPRPVQTHVPIWIGGGWPGTAPFRRAARWDGAFPMGTGASLLAPAQLAEVRTYVEAHRRSRGPYDYVVGGFTSSPTEAEHVAAFRDAGATWWLECLHDDWTPGDRALRRVEQGPPRI